MVKMVEMALPISLMHLLTFVDFLHGVFVGVGLLVESPEVLNDAQASPSFLRDTKKGEL